MMMNITVAKADIVYMFVYTQTNKHTIEINRSVALDEGS